MAFKKNPPLWTSIILHLVVLLCLFLATIVEAFRPKEPPHVFEMVSPPADSTEQPSPQPVEPTPPLDMPEVTPLDPLPDIKVPQPTPQKRPEPVKPKPKTVSYEDFLKQNPINDPKPQPVRQAPKFNRPVIEAPKIVVPPATVQNPNPVQLSQSDLNELAAYNARLRARIDAAWRKPANLGGIQIEATVEFDVAANGRITNVRLKPSSGNAAFDQSVKAAFASVANAGPTPTRQSHTFSMTFRMAN